MHGSCACCKTYGAYMLFVVNGPRWYIPNISYIFRNGYRFTVHKTPFVGSSRKIGFTASVPSTSKYWNSGTLVFSKVITNTGNGYNPNNGVFTAPVRGKYVFFVNVQCLDKQSIYVDIVLNDRTVLRTMAYSNYDAGPNLAVLSLRQEDRVWVRHAEGRGYFNDPTRPLTTFSGFLLWLYCNFWLLDV